MSLSDSPHTRGKTAANSVQPQLKAAELMQQIQGGSEHQNVHASQIRAKFECIIVQRRLLQTEIFSRILHLETMCYLYSFWS